MLEIIDFIVSEEKEMIWAGQTRVVSLTLMTKEGPFELKATSGIGEVTRYFIFYEKTSVCFSVLCLI